MSAAVAVAGAGVSGATIARRLADAGRRVVVFDPRPHVAGNCHTERDATGVMVHRYGPHIFHTDDARVWAFVNRFAEFGPYRHRVRAITGGRSFQLPLNLTTLSTFFDVELDETSARRLIADRAAPFADRTADTFEDAALRTIGAELYEAFFRGYTRKQWGRDPTHLPASVFARLPIRFVADDAYFDHPHQGIPVAGYTAMVTAMLEHPNIALELGARLLPEQCRSFAHVVWTAPLDEFFGHALGRLPYRTLDFADAIHDGDHQGCAVVNQCDEDVPVTRSTEHAHFTPWERHARTVVTSEVPRAHEPGDIEYYPVRLAAGETLVERYAAMAAGERDVTFVGRLGTFRYLDMDRSIGEALAAADRLLSRSL